MTGTTIHIPTLRTERLVMRAPRMSDLETYAAFRGSERAKGVGGPYGFEASYDNLCAIVGHWHLEGYGRWMVTDLDDTPLGVVGLMNTPEWPEPEIAWSVFANAEGKGVAYEAALVSRDYAYNTLGWTTAISCVIPGNDRSAALARRMGATQDGEFTHPDLGTLHIFRHLAPEALQ
ncbi:MAG: GNAT family N-acetyltransferase [Pseudomonadota bacterium]